jgi:hypothetical protein
MPKGIYKGNKGKILSDETKQRISESISGERNHSFGKKHSDATKEKMRAAQAGKKYNKGAHWKLSSEQVEKIRIRQSGETNSGWIKDRTELKTDRLKSYDTQYKNWMLKVKSRDDWKCKINNHKCGGRLEAHHILNWTDYPELRYDINNGVTLCKEHHPRGRSNEKKFEKILTNLVKTSI